MGRARAIAVRALVAALAVTAIAWGASSFTAVYVGGDSMAPALVRGDLAVIRRDAAAARFGDVVLVDRSGWPSGVLHRVVAVTFDERLRLKGDANPTPDLDPVSRTSVRGVVAFVVPTGRVMAVLDALARMVQSRLT
jgi:signal peptidase